MNRKPPHFTLEQLDALLAEKCTEDEARLAWHGPPPLDDLPELTALYVRADVQLREVHLKRPGAPPVVV